MINKFLTAIRYCGNEQQSNISINSNDAVGCRKKSGQLFNKIWPNRIFIIFEHLNCQKTGQKKDMKYI